MERLDSKVFAEHLNTQFHVQLEPGELLVLELFDVTERNDSANTEQFSLLFRCPLSPLMPQGIRILEHSRLGKLDLFLVPLGTDQQGVCYQAIFNRLKKT